MGLFSPFQKEIQKLLPVQIRENSIFGLRIHSPRLEIDQPRAHIRIQIRLLPFHAFSSIRLWLQFFFSFSNKYIFFER